MFGDGALGFREFAMREPLPLATIHGAVLEFLRGRRDVVLFGAQAVNAYVEQARMTQDVDLLSASAADLAEELRAFLAQRFKIAVRTRAVKQGAGYRLYQVRKPKNRHLVDVRAVGSLPAHRTIKRVQVATPIELIVQKVVSLASRRKTPKGMTDLADLRRLLLAFPDLKVGQGPVTERLRAVGAGETALGLWRTIAAEEILPEDEDAEF
jgi:hypothetical protein